MKLIEQIKSDLKEAMKNKIEAKILTYRGLLSAIHNKEIELKKEELDEGEAIKVVEGQAKQRRDSIGEFEKGGRQDLVDKEKAELELIEKYLPAKMSDDEISKIVDEAIKNTKASGMGDMGKVMQEVMKLGKGQVDGATASGMVKEKLSS